MAGNGIVLALGLMLFLTFSWASISGDSTGTAFVNGTFVVKSTMGGATLLSLLSRS